MIAGPPLKSALPQSIFNSQTVRSLAPLLHARKVPSLRRRCRHHILPAEPAKTSTFSGQQLVCRLMACITSSITEIFAKN